MILPATQGLLYQRYIEGFNPNSAVTEKSAPTTFYTLGFLGTTRDVRLPSGETLVDHYSLSALTIQARASSMTQIAVVTILTQYVQ